MWGQQGLAQPHQAFEGGGCGGGDYNLRMMQYSACVAQIMKRVLGDVHLHFKDHVRSSRCLLVTPSILYLISHRGEKLQGTEEELFNGAVWAAEPALRLGLIDGIKSMDCYIEEKWGDEVKVERLQSKMEAFLSSVGSSSLSPPSLESMILENRLKVH